MLLLSAFLLGLLGSLHCVGMCGPIAFMLPLGSSKGLKKIQYISTYHLGRLFTYTLIGVLFGSLGKSVALFGWQQYLSIATGVLMILAVLIPRFTHWMGGGKFFTKIIGKIKNALGSNLQKKSTDTFLTIGFLNGFLPCGLVYMAVMGSLANADIWAGAAYMIFFGLGTIPLLTAAIFISGILKKQVVQKLRKLIPLFVILIGILFILRGLGLGIKYISPTQTPMKHGETSIECAPEN